MKLNKFLVHSAKIILLLISIFWLEENVRAYLLWHATRLYWESKGETLDLRKLEQNISVPDSKNMALIPLFKRELTMGPSGQTSTAVFLKDALKDSDAIIYISDDHSEGYLNRVKQRLLNTYSLGNPLPGEIKPSEQLDALFPCLNAVRKAANEKPFCRFPILEDEGAQRFSSSFHTQLKILTKLLSYHANFAIEEQKNEIALQDIHTLFVLASTPGDVPSISWEIFSEATTKPGLGAIDRGLQRHLWTDNELRELELVLKKNDSLTKCQRSLKGEATAIEPIINYISGSRFYWGFFMTRYSLLYPYGWYSFDKRAMVNFLFNVCLTIHPEVHRVDLEKMHDVNEDYLIARIRSASGSRSQLLNMIYEYYAEREPASECAFVQTFTDETRIACALERYRLAHQQYPSTLTLLCPDYLDTMPTDVYDGSSYHYSLQPEGTFHLYSPGPKEELILWDRHPKEEFIWPCNDRY